MTTLTSTVRAGSQLSALSAAILALGLGIALVFVTGHVQASALHDAAHDVRHATGFPCH